MRFRIGFAMTLGIAAFALASQNVGAGKTSTGPYSPPTYQPKLERPEAPKTYQPKVERPQPPATYRPSGPTYTNRR